MSNEKIDPNKKDTAISSADDLVKPTKSGDAELSEEELKKVAGGGVALKFTKIETKPIVQDDKG